MEIQREAKLKIIAAFCMAILVVASNILVEYPINHWITWGALTYPVTYLITELMNRFYGPQAARKVVYSGFLAAIFLSFWVANKRIALASTTAFLISQLLDISLFNRFRRGSWWVAPVVASCLATSIDTILFFSVAFAGTDFPWVTVALGDWCIKFGMDIVLLLPFRVFLGLNPLKQTQPLGQPA